MIVCHCKAVSDRTIREAVQRGARSPREIVLACNAGRLCGACMPSVREIIERETCVSGIDAASVPAAAAS